MAVVDILLAAIIAYVLYRVREAEARIKNIENRNLGRTISALPEIKK